MTDRLARLLEMELENLQLKPLSLELLRERAPGVVTSQVTYDRATKQPAAGGLFDEAIFGAGASLNPPALDDEEPVADVRALRFGRILLGAQIEHPLCRSIEELPVLPPSLRPIFRRNGELHIDDRNLKYREVLVHAGRLKQLRALPGMQAELLEHTRLALTQAVRGLLDHQEPEGDEELLRDANGREISSLSGLLIPTPETAVAALDRAVGNGLQLSGPLPLRWHRMVATLFALGLTVTKASQLH